MPPPHIVSFALRHRLLAGFATAICLLFTVLGSWLWAALCFAFALAGIKVLYRRHVAEQRSVGEPMRAASELPTSQTPLNLRTKFGGYMVERPRAPGSPGLAPAASLSSATN